MAERLPPLAADEVLGSPFLLIGTEAQLTDELRRHRERFSISYYTVFEKDLERFAPTVAALSGT